MMSVYDNKRPSPTVVPTLFSYTKKRLVSSKKDIVTKVKDLYFVRTKESGT